MAELLSVQDMKFKLPSGIALPLVGCKFLPLKFFHIFDILFLVGTYNIRGEEMMKRILDYALSAGYRLFGKD